MTQLSLHFVIPNVKVPLQAVVMEYWMQTNNVTMEIKKMVMVVLSTVSLSPIISVKMENAQNVVTIRSMLVSNVMMVTQLTTIPVVIYAKKM